MRCIRAHLPPDRWPEVTADERIIPDHDLKMQDIREGVCDGLFIIGVFALLIWGSWMFI